MRPDIGHGQRLLCLGTPSRSTPPSKPSNSLIHVSSLLARRDGGRRLRRHDEVGRGLTDYLNEDGMSTE